jgi:hypothetical protein
MVRANDGRRKASRPDSYKCFLFATGRKLAGNQRRATRGDVAVTSSRTAVDDHGRVATGDGRGPAVPFPGAGDRIADPRDALSAGVRSGAATDYRAAVTGGVTDDDEGACHMQAMCCK